MSASSKKKLRKEQNAAAMTEKQLQEQKEAKKLKQYTITFAVVMVLVVAIVIGIFVRVPVNGALDRGTQAVTIGDRKLNTTQFNYFYETAISNLYSTYYNNYQDMAALYAQIYEGIDFTSALDKQNYPGDVKLTWADYFVNEAIETATSVYTLYDMAMADKEFQLSEDEQKSLDNLEANLQFSALYAGFSSVDSYLRSSFGDGATVESYKEYYTASVIASAYYSKYAEELEFDNDDLREFEKDKLHDYSSYDYSYYYVNVNNYRGEGTKDEDGNVSYTDEQMQAAREAARQDAEALAAGTYKDVEELNKALAALEINKEKKDVAATTNTNTLGSNITNEDIREWLDGERKENEIGMITLTNTSTDADGKETEVVSGYYVIMFHERNLNEMKLVNVRHILVQFEGGTKNSTTGETTYSETEKNAAKTEAEALLKQWQDGEKPSEDTFAELAKSKTDDSGSKETGGLYENVYPGQMVENFDAWCFDEARKPGDTGIVETEYGYHIMYFVEETDTTYRDYMLENDLRTETATEWHDGIVEAVKNSKDNLSRVDTDKVFLS